MELERKLLACVEHGQLADLTELFRAPSTGRPGNLSTDELRQQKNLLICTATLVTRAAIRGGLDQQTAFALSDFYIQKAELLSSSVHVTNLNAQMVTDFTERVAQLGNGACRHKLVRDVRDHVQEHINQIITTASLAQALHLNRTYLCQDFKAKTGQSVRVYVTQIKIDEAKRLLALTDRPLAEIAEQLGFSSQSYFHKVFRKHTGLTPQAYRRQT